MVTPGMIGRSGKWPWKCGSLLTYFMAIDKCKFRRMVVPGDVLELHCTVKRPGGKIWKFEGTGMVEGQVCAQAEFTAMMDLKTDE